MNSRDSFRDGVIAVSAEAGGGFFGGNSAARSECVTTTHRERGIIPGCVPAVDVWIERSPEEVRAHRASLPAHQIPSFLGNPASRKKGDCYVPQFF
jgi:hypothetical protein